MPEHMKCKCGSDNLDRRTVRYLGQAMECAICLRRGPAVDVSVTITEADKERVWAAWDEDREDDERGTYVHVGADGRLGLLRYMGYGVRP